MKIPVLILLFTTTFSMASELRIRIPSNAIQDLVNPSLAQEPIKFDIPELPIEANHLNFSDAPEIVRVYGKHLFGFELSGNNSLDIQIKNTRIQSNVELKSVEFQSRENQSTAILNLELDQLQIAINEVWLKELNVTNLTTNDQNSCSHKTRHAGDYFQNHLWAKIFNVDVHSSNQNQKIKIKAFVKLKNQKDLLQFELLEIQNNIASVIDEKFKMNIAKINLAPIYIKVDGECFPVDTSAVKQFLDSKLQEIKNTVFKAAQGWIVNEGVKKANEALSKISLPNSQSFTVDPGKELYKNSQIVVVRDETKRQVRRQYLLDSNRDDMKSSVSFFDWFYQFGYAIGLSGFSRANSNELVLDLDEKIILNNHVLESHHVNALTQSDDWEMFPQDMIPKYNQELLTQDASIIIRPEYFIRKINFLDQINYIRNKFLPNGIDLGVSKLKWEAKSESYLKIAIPVIINLSAMNGLGPAVGQWIEKNAGHTGGIIGIPLQIQLRLKRSYTPKNKLQILMSVNRNFQEDEFGRKSNSDQAAGIIQWILKKQLNELADDVEHADISIDLDGNLASCVDLVGFDRNSNVHVFFNTHWFAEKLKGVQK